MVQWLRLGAASTAGDEGSIPGGGAQNQHAICRASAGAVEQLKGSSTAIGYVNWWKIILDTYFYNPEISFLDLNPCLHSPKDMFIKIEF